MNESRPGLMIPGETREAYRLFCHYLKQGPDRSITKTVKAFPKHNRRFGNSSIRSIAIQYFWRQRALQWDIKQMLQNGDKFMKHYMGSLGIVARKIHKALKESEVGSPAWNASIKALEKLRDDFPEEGPRLMAQRAQLPVVPAECLQLPNGSDEVRAGGFAGGVDVGQDDNDSESTP